MDMNKLFPYERIKFEEPRGSNKHISVTHDRMMYINFDFIPSNTIFMAYNFDNRGFPMFEPIKKIGYYYIDISVFSRMSRINLHTYDSHIDVELEITNQMMKYEKSIIDYTQSYFGDNYEGFLYKSSDNMIRTLEDSMSFTRSYVQQFGLVVYKKTYGGNNNGIWFDK